MYSVWGTDRDTDNREFVAVFRDRHMAWLFIEAVGFAEHDNIIYEIVDVEPEEGR